MGSFGLGLWGFHVAFVVLLSGSLTCAASPPVVSLASRRVCPIPPLSDSILGFRDWSCSPTDVVGSIQFVGVTEGGEISLQKALNIVHKNNRDYVAVLFYASWCPFSRIFRPNFSIMSSLYPSIPHFAIEESTIRPSILSKYGVHGFPTLFILNSTMRVRYHGSRTLMSLFGFYSDVTGIRTFSLDQPSLEKIGSLSDHEKHGHTEPESCPFSWARSPENLLRQETYLALATTFVLLRLLYFSFPTFLACVLCVWRSFIQNLRLGSLLEHPLVYLKRIVQSISCLRVPCKRSNLQEGALNAKVWASKSLATVSIGEGSTSRGMHQ